MIDLASLHKQIPIPFFLETCAFLFTVVTIVPLFKRFGISPILGFLAVGALIGPHALALISDAEDVQHFAELGVVFLLFTIGMELSLDRLKSYAPWIFGLGLLQVLLTAIVIALIAFSWGNPWQASTVIGLCLALSSTAMVMQLLGERGEIATPHGRSAFSILLLQDLAVVPILILLSFLASDEASAQQNTARALLKAVAAVGLIILSGRYLLGYCFRVVARTRSTEVFTALTLLIILLTSALTALSGLSLALGAFLAGLVLAETEFRYQIESEIEAFKGLFLGLFFMGVGMNLDFVLAFERGVWVILAVLGLLMIKASIIFLLAKSFRLKTVDALHCALLLAQGGEFAFVVIGQATLNYPLLSLATGQFMVVVAGLSMAFTPLLAILAQKLRSRFAGPKRQGDFAEMARDLQGHCIIAGYGRVGKTVARLLTQNRMPFIALDTSPDCLAQDKNHKAPIYFGDVSRVELLKRAGADRAKCLVLTVNDAKVALSTVKTVQHYWPSLPVIVRTRDRAHGVALRRAGADAVILETLESSLELSALALEALGLSPQESRACVDSARRDELSVGLNFQDPG